MWQDSGRGGGVGTLLLDAKTCKVAMCNKEDVYDDSAHRAVVSLCTQTFRADTKQIKELIIS